MLTCRAARMACSPLHILPNGKNRRDYHLECQKHLTPKESIRTAKQVFFNGQEETVSTNGLIPDNSLNVRIIHLSDYSLETQTNIIVLFRYRNTCVKDVRSIKGAKKKKLTEINNKLLTAIQENKPACRIPKSIKIDYY